MSERLPLHATHEQTGATFAEVEGWLVPARYGDPAAEHEAVRERAGLIDRSERGKIEVTGKDRATFLHGLVSNDVKGLTPGQGNESALLDVHGKVIDAMEGIPFTSMPITQPVLYWSLPVGAGLMALALLHKLWQQWAGVRGAA